MPLIMGLSGFRGTGLAGLRGPLGIPRARTLAGLYGATDIIKAHPLLLIAGVIFGGYWATRHAEGKGLVSSTWGDQRYEQGRTRSLHGARRRRR